MIDTYTYASLGCRVRAMILLSYQARRQLIDRCERAMLLGTSNIWRLFMGCACVCVLLIDCTLGESHFS